MRNWPKERKSAHKVSSRSGRTQVTISHHSPISQWRPMDFLQWHDVSNYRDEGRNVACPSDVELDFFGATFYDVVFVEDFSKLCEGLIALRKSIRSQAVGPYCEDDDIYQWFHDVRKPGKEKIFRDFGYFDLSKTKPRPLATRKLHITASLVCSSTIVLHLTATPTKIFQERFRTIIAQEVEVKVRLRRFSLFNRNNNTTTRSIPMSVRHEEVEDLLLEMNKDVTSFLRQYLQLGWSMSGPLPSVEQFLLKSGTCNQTSSRDFWHALEMSNSGDLHYEAPGVRVFSPSTFFKNRVTEPFRVLVAKDDFLNSTTRQGFPSERIAVEHSLDRQCVFPLVDILALRECSQRLAKRIAFLHELLAGFLSRRNNRKLAGISDIRKAFAEMIRLNQLVFECHRIEMETSSDNLADLVERLSLFKRKVQGGREESGIGDEMAWQIKNLRKYASEHIAILKENYKETLAFNIQRFGFMMTVLGLFLALLQFVPQSTKQEPVDWAINHLSDLLSWLFNAKGLFGR